MEEQNERSNPIRRGAGATPSAGLSQFRGGSTRMVGCGTGAGRKQYESESDEECGAGTGAGRRRKHPKHEEMSEAMAQGLHLGRHLHALHGGAFHKDFVDGMIRGGGFWGDVWDGIKSGAQAVGNFVRPIVAPVGNALGSMVGVPMAGTMADAGLRMAGLGKRRGGKKALLGRTQGSYGNPDVPAGGRFDYNDVMKGGARTGAYEGEGTGAGRKKRPASEAQKKRGALVSRLMRERGCSLGEASKIIKAEGLM
jgi:hypothetical protein